MAKRRSKPLVFQFEDSVVSFDMVKVDRSKLYGFKELEVNDGEGNPCELATLADDGKTVIGKGGTGIGQISSDGIWCDKTQLMPVDIEGEEITPVTTSFGTTIPLEQTATLDTFLNHNIRLCYIMESEDLHESLMEKLKNGTIFQFPYSYRGGLVADTGFLLLNSDGQIFFLVGDPTAVEFVGLQQAASVVAETADETEDSEDSLMDFGMI